MDALVADLGGSVYVREACPEGCVRAHAHARQRMYDWSLANERAAVAVRAVLPYLIVKRERAEEALEAWQRACWETRGRSRRCRFGSMNRIRDEMRLLGWPRVGGAM